MAGRRRCRSNLARNTVNARKARSARNKESSTEREARLSRLRDLYRDKRARESAVEREIRLSRERNRVRRTREQRRKKNPHPILPKDEILRNIQLIKKEMDYVNNANCILKNNTVPMIVPLLDNEHVDITVDKIKTEPDFDEINCELDIEIVPDEQEDTINIKVEETEQQQQSTSSVLIELMPLSLPQPQTSQVPLAIQPIQQNGIVFCRRTSNK